MLRNSFCFFFLLFGLFSAAQVKPGVIFHRYQKSDGLSSNEVRNVVQDQEGFLWIATSRGLQRFDGHHFKTFNTANEPRLLSNDISNIFCDSKNRLWLQYAFKGLGYWNLNTGEKKNFTPLLSDSTSLPDQRTFTFYEDHDGEIWISVHLQGVVRFNEDEENFRLFRYGQSFPKPRRRTLNTSRCIADHPQNPEKLLIGTFDGLLVMDKETGAAHELPISASNAENPETFNGKERVLLDIYVQNDSLIWLATFGGGLLRYNLNEESFRSIKVEPAFPANPVVNNVHQFAQKDAHHLWVSIYKKGLYLLDMETERLEMLNQKPDGSSELAGAMKMLPGKFGHLWCASVSGLFKIYNEYGFQDYHFTGYPLRALAQNSADLKLSLPHRSNHIKIYNPNWNLVRQVNFEPVRFADINFLTALHPYQNKFYVQAFEGLHVLDSSLQNLSPVEPFYAQLADEGRLSIITSMLDSRGNIWMGTKVKGLYRYDIDREKLHHYSPQYKGSQPVSHRWIVSLYEDHEGMVWIGSEKGYGYFNHKDQAFVNFPYPENSLALDSVHFKECIGFAENTSGELWIGAKEGALGLFDKEEMPQPKLFFESRHKLRNHLLNGITEDEDQVYIQLNNGFTLIDKATHNIRNFSSAFGADQIHNVLSGARLAIGNGFASARKLQLNDLPSPRIYVGELMLAGKETPFNGENIEVSFRENSISLELGILDLVEKERAQLQYRLSGKKQSKWISAVSGQLLNFPYLDHGKYLLEVQAISPSGKVWQHLKIPVKIVPLLWQRWYIQLLLLLLGLALLAFPVLYRFRQKRHREQMQLTYEREIADLKNKALKAQVNPHFLFNSLNSIRLLVMKGDEEKATAGISTFSRLVRRILVHSDKNEVSLADELQAVREYIALEQMRFTKPFLLKETVDSNVALESVKVPPMLIQPFVENAIWHGLRQKKQGALLEIEVRSIEKGLLISIRDNGIGRQAARSTNGNGRKSFGINISRERLKHFQPGETDEIEIRDLYDNNGQPLGTEVNIRIEA